MIATSILVGYVVVLGFGCPRLLAANDWPRRAPRLGLLMWSALIGATLVGLVGAGVTATVPLLRVIGGARELVHLCRYVTAAALAHPVALAAGVVGAGLAVGIVGAVFFHLTREGVRSVRDARAHLAELQVVSRAQDGVIVLDAEQPAAWCVGTGGGHVVLTSGACAVLTPPERAAVIAHERAHLRGHHHLVTVVVSALSRVIRLPVLQTGSREVSVLLEMCADDVAARKHGRSTVAAALLTLSGVGPVFALQAGALSVGRRFERLSGAADRLPSRSRIPICAMAVLTLSVPFLVAVPAVAGIVDLHFCPLPG